MHIMHKMHTQKFLSTIERLFSVDYVKSREKNSKKEEKEI